MSNAFGLPFNHSLQNVLVLDPIDEDALEDLKRKFNVISMTNPIQRDLDPIIEIIDIIILRSSMKLDSRILHKAKRLKIIARAGVGTDNIDVLKARELGISVFNIPSESSRSVAELCFGLIFALSRNIVLADRQTLKKSQLTGMELKGKIIGVVGLGNIGSEIVKIAQAFGMHTIGTVNNTTEERRISLAQQGITLTNLDQLLRKSDVVCLTVPLTEKTKGLISYPELAIMKRSAFLVNVSRAGIVNHDDLLKALVQKIINGFATDFLPNENGANTFSGFDNVVATPHIGAMTLEAQSRIGQEIVKGIDARLVERGSLTKSPTNSTMAHAHSPKAKL